MEPQAGGCRIIGAFASERPQLSTRMAGQACWGILEAASKTHTHTHAYTRTTVHRKKNSPWNGIHDLFVGVPLLIEFPAEEGKAVPFILKETRYFPSDLFCKCMALEARCFCFVATETEAERQNYYCDFPCRLASSLQLLLACLFGPRSRTCTRPRPIPFPARVFGCVYRG